MGLRKVKPGGPPRSAKGTPRPQAGPNTRIDRVRPALTGKEGVASDAARLPPIEIIDDWPFQTTPET